MTWAALAREVVRLVQDTQGQTVAANAALQQQQTQRALAAAAILSAMRPAPSMPTHIYVSPCTIYNQIARQC
jgi:hypothetical protein